MSESKNYQLSAINQRVIDNLPDPTESKIRGKQYISWGADNNYPEYLWNLYLNSTTLQSVINAIVDYVAGDGANVDEETLRQLILDYAIFGGVAVEVIRRMDGGIYQLNAISFPKVRSNAEGTVFYVADDWTAWGAKGIEMPAFDPDKPVARSLYYYKGSITRGVYPIPIYNAAILAAETEKEINKFHLCSINNGFAGNTIINMNNGRPSDEQKDEIERAVNDKFTGSENSGRIMIVYNDSKDNAATVERIATDSFADQYNATKENVRSQIFSAWRMNPNLVGYSTAQGFNSEEFDSAFKLFNRTMIKPIQKIFKRIYKDITGEDLVITPFSIE